MAAGIVLGLACFLLLLGTSSDGDDCATLVGAPWGWKQARRMVMSKRGAPEFKMRQYLFSAQVGLCTRLLHVRHPCGTFYNPPSSVLPINMLGPHSKLSKLS